MDTTVCIHPFANSPFSSFAHKLATAKLLGFDPEPMREDEQFLKVWNGDLSNDEDWNCQAGLLSMEGNSTSAP
jgi:hypothetical protein